MKSMTGFGRGHSERSGSSVTIEISTVNHRQRDLRISLPSELGSLETILRRRIEKEISRGAITLSLEYELAPELRQEQLRIDSSAAGYVLRQLQELAEQHGLTQSLRLADILAVPGVIVVKENRVPEKLLAELADEALRKALQELLNDRQAEGEALLADLQPRHARLRELIDAIEQRKDEALILFRKRLQERIKLLGVEVDIYDDRLIKEVAFAAQKSDVTEELVRISSHLRQFAVHLHSTGDAAGRHLQFIAQELQREINTLSAKSSETSIADMAIEFKAELERIREQLCNVE